MAKYSFIVPVYNVEKYLIRCLDSILNQTYQNFEVIIVDDGSTDSSGSIVDIYKKKYPEQIIVEHQYNKGLGGARNTGIALAKGQYLLMVDSDDYISHRMLETIEQYLNKYDNDILIFDFVIEEEDGRQQVEHLHETTGYVQITQRQFLLETPSAWNKVYKASLFKNTDLRYPERIYYEDVAMSPCLAIYASNIGIINVPLYYYIQRNTSIIHTKDIQRMTEICTAVGITLEYYKKKRLFEQYYKELEYLTVGHILVSGVQRIVLSQYDYKSIVKLEKFVENYFPNYEKNYYVQRYPLKSGSKREKKIIRKRHLYLYMEYMLRRVIKRVKQVKRGWSLLG